MSEKSNTKPNNQSLLDSNLNNRLELDLKLNELSGENLNDSEPKRTFKMESDVLSKLKDFLPKMKNANQQLSTGPAQNIDSGFYIKKLPTKSIPIPNLELPNKGLDVEMEESEEGEQESENDGDNESHPYIEMDLGLGVFDAPNGLSEQLGDVPTIELPGLESDESPKKPAIEEV